jgi:hypothetical protein
MKGKINMKNAMIALCVAMSLMFAASANASSGPSFGSPVIVADANCASGAFNLATNICLVTGGGGGGVTAVTAMSPVVSSGGSTPSISMPVATTSVDGYLGHLDFSTFNAKQSALTFGNVTGTGFSISGGTGAIIGSGLSLALTTYHDLYVTRTGTDASGCGAINNPCHTVGYTLGLVGTPSSTNTWIIHISDRCDAETGDLLIPPYVFLTGAGGDVAAYLRLPAGKASKISSGWTVNGRSGLQSIYLGGGTSVNLDFASLGGSAGSNFVFDDVYVTGTFNHTGRGVNGGDYLYINDSLIFGAATLTGDQLQSNNTTWGSTFAATTSSTVNTDMTFMSSNISGNFSDTETNSQESSVTFQQTSITGTYSLSGTDHSEQ